MKRPKLWVVGHKLYYNRPDMNPDNQQNSPVSQPPAAPDDNPYKNPLNVMSPGEQVLGEIRRHPFGLFGMYLTCGLIIILVMVAAIFAPTILTGISAQDKSYLLVGAIIISVITVLFLYVGVTVYNGNRWIVTSDSITQVSQVSLFNTQTSQLSLANLEDVTYAQNSLVQTIFGFGTLKVETAGERSKFSFPFCPKPAYWARRIIQAHEDFIRQHPEEGHNAGLAVDTNP